MFAFRGRQAILPTSRAAAARLLYIPAGVAVPGHGHRGMELTVVLQGAFRECEDRFGVGDPEIAGAGADCICLTATDAPFRFKEWVLRMFFRI